MLCPREKLISSELTDRGLLNLLSHFVVTFEVKPNNPSMVEESEDNAEHAQHLTLLTSNSALHAGWI